jgi:hypothetical protein
MAATPDGKGYWMVASDGGIFNFGDAAFAGSAAGGPSLDPAERVVSTTTGHGYWVEEQNGTADAFGDAVGAPPTEALMFSPSTRGDKAVLFAFAQLGKPYVWAGTDRWATTAQAWRSRRGRASAWASPACPTTSTTPRGSRSP